MDLRIFQPLVLAQLLVELSKLFDSQKRPNEREKIERSTVRKKVMLFSVSHSLKKAFALAATTSSWGNLSEFVSTTRSISTTAVHSTGSSVGDTSVIENKKATAKNLLFDVPVSNNGGRCRIIL